MAELQQFCILARTQKSRACAALIQQVLGHRKIFVFGELLDQASVQSLNESEFSKAYNSLELFAFGTFQDYIANPDNYLELSDVQLTKLKQLSLVSLAASSKSISYDTLHKELGIDNTRALEDLVIDAMYAGLLSGKLDPAGSVFHVTSAMARDVKPESIAELIEALSAWRGCIKELAEEVAQSSAHMAKQREMSAREQKEIEDIVELRKKEIKTAVESGEPLDEALFTITGEDVLGGNGGGRHGGGKGSGKGEGQLGGKSKLSHQGQRSTAGKHPRHQPSGMGGIGQSSFAPMFGRR